MNEIIQFIQSVCTTIGDYVGLPARTIGYIGLGLIALLLILFIAIIVKCAKKRKAKKKAKAKLLADAKKQAESVKEQPQPIAQPVCETVEETPEQVVEEKVVDEKVEQQLDTIEEKVEQVEEEQPKVVEPEKEETIERKVSAKKPVAKKGANKKTTQTKPAKKLFGKWTVQFKSQGEYMSTLSASNGEIMLSSEIYTTEDGARNGIATIIKGVDSGKFVIYQDKNKNYYYKLKTANNRLLCVGEIYKSKEQCLKAVETVKRIASGSTIVQEVALGAEYVTYTPAELSTEIKKGTEGKWRIETNESGLFSAKLYASNGQLMMATEEVSLKKSAENAILSVKKNAVAGNFIIDRDKFGRFYYKLRNAQKSVICIGEAYDTLDSCVRAIESVRRFASTAIVVDKED